MIPKLGISISYFAILFSSIKELEVATGYFQLLNGLLGGRGRTGAQLPSCPSLPPWGRGRRGAQLRSSPSLPPWGGEEGSSAPLLPLPSPPWERGRRELRSSPSLLPPGDDVWQKSLPKVGWQNRRRRLFDKINVARQSDSKVAEL